MAKNDTLGTSKWISSLLIAFAAAVAPNALPSAAPQSRWQPPLVTGATPEQPVHAGAAAANLAPVASYIATRWPVDLATASTYVFAAADASRATGVDPLLLLAVIARESDFVHVGNADNLEPGVDPASVDPLRPHGPMQVDGRWHLDKMPTDGHGRVRPTTLQENVYIGAQVLSEYLQRTGGDLRAALHRYNGCSRNRCGGYSAAVLRVRDDLQRIFGST